MAELLFFYAIATFVDLIAILLSRIILKRSVAFTNSLVICLVAYIIALMAFFIAKFGLIHTLWAGTVAVISVLVSGKYFSATVSKPLKDLTKTIDQLAKGDLSAEFDPGIREKKNEIGVITVSLSNMLINLKQSVEIANKVAQGYIGFGKDSIKGNGDLDNALKKMVSKLSEVIDNILQAAHNVSGGSEQISQTASSLSGGVSDQASSAEEASSSLEQLSVTTGQNTENAKHSSSIVIQIKERLDTLVKAVNDTYLAMNAIVEKVGIIDSIANKTDILAINASIEAVKAGEQGKGFSVIAAEVRRLAETSLNSAMEIESLSRNSMQKAENSNILLNELTPEIMKATDLVKEITQASIEQSAGINQVNIAIQQLNDVTQNNASIAEELSSSAEELSGQSESLYKSISFFKTSEEKLEI